MFPQPTMMLLGFSAEAEFKDYILPGPAHRRSPLSGQRAEDNDPLTCSDHPSTS